MREEGQRDRAYGNVAHTGFEILIKAANECKIPVFSPAPFEVLHGAVASFFPDFQEGGVEAGKMIARILKGESPGKIPFYQLKTAKLAVNPASAGKAGVSLPQNMVQQADTVVGGAQKK
jgi:putative ABC transport system substrate-binding protein